MMKMMATGGPLLATQHCQEVKRKWTKRGVVESRSFRYPCPIDWHYKFRHAIDVHNNLCHSLLLIKDTWRTTCWEIRVFAFIIVISEVNAFLAVRFFCFANGTFPGMPTLCKFRLKLAWQLIQNRWLQEEDTEEQRLISTVHMLTIAPNNTTRYVNQNWVCNAKDPYQQYQCR